MTRQTPSLTRRMIAGTLARIAFNDAVTDALAEQLAAWTESDWRALFACADDEDLLSLLFARLEARSGLCPPALLREVAPRVEQRREWSARRIKLMHEVLSGLGTAGVQARTIKGFALGADVYGDSLLRDSHDVDLLVRPVDAHAAACWLYRRGYHARCEADWFGDHSFLRALREASFTALGGVLDIDLHWRIDQPWLPQITPVDALLTRQVRRLNVGGNTLAWYSPLDVASLQASNIINGWDTELRSVVDFARSVARLERDELSALDARFRAADAAWVLHVLVAVAGAVCGLDQGMTTRITPLPSAWLRNKVETVSRAMVDEALDVTQAGADPVRVAHRNRRFAHGIGPTLQLALHRMRPGMADYAATPPGRGALLMRGIALRRRIDARVGGLPGGMSGGN